MGLRSAEATNAFDILLTREAIALFLLADLRFFAGKADVTVPSNETMRQSDNNLRRTMRQT